MKPNVRQHILSSRDSFLELSSRDTISALVEHPLT
jgi:hypothetical protein